MTETGQAPGTRDLWVVWAKLSESWRQLDIRFPSEEEALSAVLCCKEDFPDVPLRVRRAE